MAVATWLQTSTTGTQATGTGTVDLVLTIPAGKKVTRVVVWGVFSGINSSNTGFGSLGTFFHQQTLILTGGGYGTKEIYHARPVAPFSACCLNDPAAGSTLNRVYTIYCAMGSETMGLNLQMSWGDIGKPAITLTYQSGIFLVKPGGQNFVCEKTIIMRALYWA